MEVYQVGKLFPLEQFCTGREQHVAIVTNSFFNVLMSLNRISKKEKELFTNGTLTAYLFERKDIPFLVLDFGQGFSIDMSIDASMFDEEFRGEWMASGSNLITLFLVEASTGVLEAMRMIGVGFADEFRQICSRHAGRTDIERQVRLIQTASLRYGDCAGELLLLSFGSFVSGWCCAFFLSLMLSSSCLFTRRIAAQSENLRLGGLR